MWEVQNTAWSSVINALKITISDYEHVFRTTVLLKQSYLVPS